MRVEKAFAEYLQLSAIAKHSDLNGLPAPDQALSQTVASREARAALDRYIRQLNIFADLVLRKRLPPEE